MIPVEQIRPNPDQPRKAIGDLRELTDSVARRACWSAVVGCAAGRLLLTLISGERRYHAARAGGIGGKLPCIEKTADDAETLEIGLIENIQRKDLTAFERGGRFAPFGDTIRVHA